MLVSEVVNSKSIALAATSDASNDIPYLGLNWFPEKKKQGLDLKWVKTHKGLPVSLKPSNFDSIPEIRAREGLKTEKSQMAFFRESMIVTEEDAQEIDRIKSADDPYLESALQSVYDDANTLVRGAEVVPERMRMQLLATVNGHPTIVVSSGGVQYSYDYDPNGEYASKHYTDLTTDATADWSASATCKPLTDLNNARKALNKLGKNPKYVLMNSNTFEYLLASKQVQDSILAQNLTANVELTDDNVISVVKNRCKLTIVKYDKMYSDGANEYSFYPDNKVTLLPEGVLGNTWFGTTPEERSARQIADADVTIYGAGIAVATSTNIGAPVITTVTASEITLPSYENMDATFVINVSNHSF